MGDSTLNEINKITSIPKYGFKVPLDHKYTECWNQKVKPRLKQLPHLIPLAFR